MLKEQQDKDMERAYNAGLAEATRVWKPKYDAKVTELSTYKQEVATRIQQRDAWWQDIVDQWQKYAEGLETQVKEANNRGFFGNILAFLGGAASTWLGTKAAQSTGGN